MERESESYEEKKDEVTDNADAPSEGADGDPGDETEGADK